MFVETKNIKVMKKFIGDLIITKENQNDFKKLETVSGYVYVRQGATFTAPALVKSGYVYLQEGATFTAPALVKSGSVYLQEGATFTAPALVEVSGYVDVRQGATFTAPVLVEVSGYVYLQEGATFTAPALVEVSGYVYVRQGATFTAPVLVEVSGYVYLQEGATFTAPALVKSGSVDVRQGATFTAPALVEVSGYVDVRQGATFTAPALVFKNNILVFNKKEYTLKHVDGMCFFYEKEKTSKGIKIYTGVSNVRISDNVVVFDVTFLTEKEGFFAHGSSVKSAISDLQFKIVSEKLRNEPIFGDTLFTVKYYRLITGACDIGCRDFMKRNDLNFEVLNPGTSSEETKEVNPIKAKELLPLLIKNNAYGVEKFKSLIDF